MREQDAKEESQEAQKENLSLPEMLRSVGVKTQEKTMMRLRVFPAKKARGGPRECVTTIKHAQRNTRNDLTIVAKWNASKTGGGEPDEIEITAATDTRISSEPK